MTTSMPSRAPLDFPERQPAKQDLTITIHAAVNGFAAEICFSGQLDQLEALTRRLRDLGMTPAGVHQGAPTTAPLGRKAAARVDPAFDTNGDPMCPKHKKPLREGQFGLYCSAKDDSTERGFCSLKFKD